MSKLVSDSIENLPLYPPGKPLDEIKREYGIDSVIKLGSNENCLGPSPKAVAAIKDSLANINRYPDNNCYYLREKLAEKFKILPEQIIFGNGSNELVQFIMLTFLLPGDEVIIGRPTFLLYQIMGRALGGKVIEVPLKKFTYDLQSIAEKISTKTKLIFISNPNNPTGTIVTSKLFTEFMHRVPEDIIVVVDEAYAEYVTSTEYPATLEQIREGKNIIMLRTFSKAYGLAGLRIGYGIGQSRIINYMERVREPFNANSLAQIGALAALDDVDHIRKTKENNALGIDYLCRKLQRMGIEFVPTQANFLLIKVGKSAGRIYKNLLKDGVIVRFMESFGLKEYIRVTVGLLEENKRFIHSLEKLMAQCP